jgi:hypothetical protein
MGSYESNKKNEFDTKMRLNHPTLHALKLAQTVEEALWKKTLKDSQ